MDYYFLIPWQWPFLSFRLQEQKVQSLRMDPILISHSSFSMGVMEWFHLLKNHMYTRRTWSLSLYCSSTLWQEKQPLSAYQVLGWVVSLGLISSLKSGRKWIKILHRGVERSALHCFLFTENSTNFLPLFV